MKKKLLVSVVTLVMAVGAMAQSDITPAKYVFANQPVGPYMIDNCNNGWGPTHAEEAKLATNGYVNMTGGAFWENKETDTFKYYQSGWQILDLTAEGIGKVLCFKGSECSDDILPQGVKATGTSTALWPQIAFYSNFANTPTGDEGVSAPFIRMSVTFKAINNEPDPAKSPIVEFEVKTATNTVANTLGGKFVSLDMMIKDIETEEYYELNEGWQKLEYDFQIGMPNGNPFAFSIKMDNAYAVQGAVLIKEIKFTTPSDGTYAKGKPAKHEKFLKFIPTGLAKEMAEDNKIRCNASDNTLSVSNVKSGDKIEVYSASGALVASQIASSDVATLPLANKGFYIVKVGDKSLKVANK